MPTYLYTGIFFKSVFVVDNAVLQISHTRIAITANFPGYTFEVKPCHKTSNVKVS